MLQKECSIYLSKAYQTTQNLTPLHFRTPPLHSKNPQNKFTQFLNTVYFMQLSVGVEFHFPLAKPSRSFQNLTETPQGKRVLLSSFCFHKVVKMATKNENRLANKTLTPKNDLDCKFFHCENVSKRCNHFLGEKSFCVYARFD